MSAVEEVKAYLRSAIFTPFEGHVSQAIAIRHAERLDTLTDKYKQVHAELLAIHQIIMCIAECPELLDSDTFTVKGVKILVAYNKSLKGEAKRLRQELATAHNDAQRMLGLIVLAAGGSVWITHKQAIGDSPTLTREDVDGDVHFTAVRALKREGGGND